MPTDANFRFSTYLTLALCCAAVGYAESAILPEVAAFALLAILALGVLYFLESRVAFLSIPAANRFGGAVAIVYFVWAAYRVKREFDDPQMMNMGWQMFLVALSGPLVMVAIVGKVARGDKHAGDYWTLHGVALAGVGMAAAFSEDLTCFLLIAAYLAAAVWSLTLLHLGRASGAVPPVPGGRQPARKTVAVAADPTGHRTDLGPAVAWAALALAAAVPLYLLTPRSTAAKVEFGTPRIEIGFSADQMVNLNRSGPLRANPETAFTFTATNSDGSPKRDVNPNQRWFGKAMRHYARGEWKAGDDLLPPVSYAAGRWSPGAGPLLARRADRWSPPDLGPGQFTLTFDVPAKLRSTFLADPVLWVPGEPAPVATLTDSGPRGWLPVPDGNFLESAPRARGAPRRYAQAYRAPDPPDAGPPFRFTDRRADSMLAPLSHLQPPMPRVKGYADAVVDGLIAEGKLPPDCRGEVTLLPRPQFQEAVARALAAHLSAARGFTYTTNLRRGDPSLDPVEDFLLVTKSGHCERYAAALALMLRSQGIPAVYVLGFKGCEEVEPGQYLVRQEFAHAWVHALVPKPGEPEVPGEPLSRVYHWVVLDPTPGALEEAAANEPWWDRANDWLQGAFQEYVKDYTPEQRRKALASFVAEATRPRVLAGAAAAVLLVLGLRFAVRRWRAPAARPPEEPEAARWLAELVAVLAPHGIAPGPGDTAREFAAAASESLRARGRAEVADVPPAWAEAYYEERFGGAAPSGERRAELRARLDALRRALAQ